MKIAPLIHTMNQREPRRFEQILIHTGQHYDARMSQVFFDELSLPRPDINLGVGSGSHAWQTAQVMLHFEPVLEQYRPDWVIVPGDVNSTLAATLVCSKRGVQLAHVEAGLRSFDRSMPEEINRILTDQMADLLLTPSPDGNENLLREGITGEKIHLVGNLMIDTLVRLLPKAEERWLQQRDALGLTTPHLLVTLHRPSNVDDPATLREFMAALAILAHDIPVIFPVHPRTRRQLAEMKLEIDHRIRLLEPLGYLDFLGLQMHAALVLTDSGGVQEETTYLGVPCLTARPNTERPVTITQGTNRLVASQRDALVAAATSVLADQEMASFVKPLPPELWDGNAAQRVADILIAFDK